jgi:hypothetical protein
MFVLAKGNRKHLILLMEKYHCMVGKKKEQKIYKTGQKKMKERTKDKNKC